MLIQLLTQHPQALGSVLKGTPTWVWGLLGGLIALGASQLRTRSVSQVRMAVMPLVMTGLSLWGTTSAFSRSPHFGYVLLAWATGAALMLGLMMAQPPAAGTRYHASTRSFTLPGSWVPLALMLGIFLTKYFVGIELTMQPALARDEQYSLIVGTLYGLFSGTFAGRAARLWRMVLRPATFAPATSTATSLNA